MIDQIIVSYNVYKIPCTNHAKGSMKATKTTDLKRLADVLP